jgi:5-deoxy-glucuronate isomerase
MSSQNQKWYFRKGELKAGDWDIHIDALNPPTAGWKYTGMRIGQVTPSKSLSISADTNERIIFILEGAQVSVSYKLVGQESQEQILQGRASVFHGSSDYIYIPRQSEVSITGAARIAVGEAPATADRPVQFTSKDKVQITLRGAGRESRQVHNLGMPDTLDADRLLVCEVIVPAGNWSGAPAHKHDCHIPGEESTLEEIYYFESAVTRSAIAPSNSSPFGYFRGFSADARPYDLAEEIHSGDVALVPYGWHGPVAAGPGYDLYFFNVMAGPDPERAWNATDHPDQAWLREAWKSQAPDPRLPYGE